MNDDDGDVKGRLTKTAECIVEAGFSLSVADVKLLLQKFGSFFFSPVTIGGIYDFILSTKYGSGGLEVSNIVVDEVSRQGINVWSPNSASYMELIKLHLAKQSAPKPPHARCCWPRISSEDSAAYERELETWSSFQAVMAKLKGRDDELWKLGYVYHLSIYGRMLRINNGTLGPGQVYETALMDAMRKRDMAPYVKEITVNPTKRTGLSETEVESILGEVRHQINVNEIQPITFVNGYSTRMTVFTVHSSCITVGHVGYEISLFVNYEKMIAVVIGPENRAHEHYHHTPLVYRNGNCHFSISAIIDGEKVSCTVQTDGVESDGLLRMPGSDPTHQGWNDREQSMIGAEATMHLDFVEAGMSDNSKPWVRIEVSQK